MVGPTDQPDRGERDVGRLLAVDGNSLGHRAWHSVRSERDAGDARPLTTGAVVSMLATAWQHGPYDRLLVGFDHPRNRRKDAYPEYKAARPPTPAPLTAALVELREHLLACGITVIEHDGAEADDILAAAVDACEARQADCDLLSSDRDLTALVSPTTRLLRPRARFSDLEIEDPAHVRARYGIEPWQYTELAALRGDPSDGLAGATGIGPKTAARLLRDHGSVAGLYAALHDLPPKVEAALREARDRVERNLLLMAPLPHLPVDIDALEPVDLDRAVDVLDGLGLDRSARRLRRAVLEPWAPPPRWEAPPPPEAPDGPDGPDPATVHDRSVPTTRDRQAAAHGEQDALF